MGPPLHGDEDLPVEVVAYSGSRGEEEPRAVLLGGRELLVREVLRRWLEPTGRFFSVATDDGHVHLLHCRDSDQSWWLVAAPHRTR